MNSYGFGPVCVRQEVLRRRPAFSLVELLTVIFIISLLISILIPALSGARTQAKNLKVNSTLKGIGDGMEMFRTENEKEFLATNGYPGTALAVDTTQGGNGEIYGAHWLVRMLLGKDLQGFVPRRNVPPSMQSLGQNDEQEFWYDADAYNQHPLDRVGPYVNPDSVETRKTKELGGTPSGLYNDDLETLEDQLVFVDVYGRPILGYTANPLARTLLAREDRQSADRGTFTQEDNMLFTGDGGVAGWDFGAGTGHLIAQFGDPDPLDIAAPDQIETFCYYILDKTAYNSTLVGNPALPTTNTTAKPARRDSFILITAGKDGLYGTGDDISNFDR